jgi:hypothetical protein
MTNEICAWVNGWNLMNSMVMSMVLRSRSAFTFFFFFS